MVVTGEVTDLSSFDAFSGVSQTYLSLIDQEIKNAKEGLPAKITCKCNGIDDPVVTSKLYEASQAGVQVGIER